MVKFVQKSIHETKEEAENFAKSLRNKLRRAGFSARGEIKIVKKGKNWAVKAKQV